MCLDCDQALLCVRMPVAKQALTNGERFLEMLTCCRAPALFGMEDAEAMEYRRGMRMVTTYSLLPGDERALKIATGLLVVTEINIQEAEAMQDEGSLAVFSLKD
jgi:hypothetical protein